MEPERIDLNPRELTYLRAGSGEKREVRAEWRSEQGCRIDKNTTLPLCRGWPPHQAAAVPGTQ